jgi:hypothetical protein
MELIRAAPERSEREISHKSGANVEQTSGMPQTNAQPFFLAWQRAAHRLQSPP